MLLLLRHRRWCLLLQVAILCGLNGPCLLLLLLLRYCGGRLRHGL